MNYNNIIVMDYETTSRFPRKTQPIQLAAVAIDGRKLEIIPDSIFQSYIKPIPDNQVKEYGLDITQEEALNVNKITRETLEKAPSLDVVWPQFTDYVNQFNPKKTKYTSPICAGYNIDRFDCMITERICGGQKRFTECEKEPYKLGPWNEDSEEQKLFHPRDTIDVMKWIWFWTENNPDVNSISFDNMRNFFGITKSGAHNAISDTLSVALLLIRFLKLERRLKINFQTGFTEENKILEIYMKEYNVSN
jgi:DNA polymerase III epsilon subunit-like protein